jgi:hypothetical protein
VEHVGIFFKFIRPVDSLPQVESQVCFNAVESLGEAALLQEQLDSGIGAVHRKRWIAAG